MQQALRKTGRRVPRNGNVCHAEEQEASMSLFALALAVATLPLQQWPMYQYESDRNAVFASPQWNVSWRAETGDKVNGGLSIVGTTLYVESFDRKLYAFDALTGILRWSAAVPNIAMNAPIVTNGVVIVGTGEPRLLRDLPFTDVVMGRPEGDEIAAFDTTTGSPVWQFHTEGQDMPTGVLVESRNVPEFVFSNGDSHVYALKAATGALLWKQPINGMSAMSSLAVDGGLLFGISSYSSAKLWLAALAAGDFNLPRRYSWTWALRPDGQFVWSMLMGNSDCSPALGGGEIMVESSFPADKQASLGYSEVYAADARTGTLLWKYVSGTGPISAKGSSEHSIAGMYDSGTFYESLPFTREFAAFDAKTGRVLWKISTHEAVKMSTVVKEGLLYVGDTDGYLYVLRTADGSALATIKFPGIFTPSPPVIVGNTLFITNAHSVYALRLTDLQQGKGI